MKETYLKVMPEMTHKWHTHIKSFKTDETGEFFLLCKKRGGGGVKIVIFNQIFYSSEKN
jgi:hypothetical protein